MENRRPVHEHLHDHDHDHEEESHFKRILRKVYLVLIAFFLITILLTNTNFGSHLISVLSGRVISTSMNDDYTFDLKAGGKVLFNESVFEALRTIYWTNQQHEIKVCLTGEKKDNNYVVSGLYIPIIYDQQVFSVRSQVCNQDTIISLHSHPPMRCIFSQQDIRSYNTFRNVNPDGIIGLMCQEERFTFFGYEKG